jgi:hypothetical protein
MITGRLLLPSRISAWAVAAPIAGSDGTSRELSAFSVADGNHHCR